MGLPSRQRPAVGAMRGAVRPRARRWGSVDMDVMTYGITRLRLVVYPPGIAAGARRRVRAWRAWPVAGLVVVLAAVLAACSAGGAPGVVVPAGCLVYGAGFVVLGAVAAPQRRLLRQVWAEDPGERATLDDLVCVARVQLLGDLLLAADEGLADGSLSREDYERVWASVYDEVGGLLAGDAIGTVPSTRA